MVIFSVVVGGAFQGYNLINRSINETRNLALVNDELENFNRLIKQAAGKSIEYQLSNRGDCVYFRTQDANGQIQHQTFKLRNSSNSLIVQEARMADAFVSYSAPELDSTNSYVACTRNFTVNADWRKITSGGQLDLALANRALLIDNTSNASISSFNSLIDNSTRTVEFWLKSNFGQVDNATILGWGDNATIGGEFVVDMEEGKVRLRSGDAYTRTTNRLDDGLWHHVMFRWKGGFLENNDLFIDGYLDPGERSDNETIVNTVGNTKLFIGSDEIIAPVASEAELIIDEVRLWNGVISDTQLYETIDRTVSPSDPKYSTNLIAYWRFENDSTLTTLNDTSAGNSLAASNIRFFKPGAPLTKPVFELANEGQARVIKANYRFVSRDDGTKGAGYSATQANEANQIRSFKLNQRIPVVRFAPAGIVAVEEGQSGGVELEIVGDHDSPSISFEAVFDASIDPQFDACNGFPNNEPGCSFSTDNSSFSISYECSVPVDADTVTCNIPTTIPSPDPGEQGDRFATIRIKDGSERGYQTVPGDKLTLQIYEPCEKSGSSGNTALLIDVGTMEGENFINRRSYVTYSWEASTSNEDVEYIFGSKVGSRTCTGATTDKVKGSPDFGVFTKRKHVSPFLFRTVDDNYNFVMGFDKPYVQWGGSVPDDGWNDASCFTAPYRFSVAATDDDEPCSSIGVTESVMCARLEDSASVDVCDNPNTSTKYCYVEFKISNMPTDSANFVKLDEPDEFTLPTSLEGMKGTNRWGNGYTDGFIVDLATNNLSQYGTTTGDPIMEVLSRAGMNYWYLQTEPDNASSGKSIKMTTNETDAVRYRMATAEVCS